MRKKCKNVKALFALWPLELRAAACIMLFPEPDRVRVDILDVSCRAGRRPPPPTPAAGMQAASRFMLTAAVMQPALHKGVFPPAHQLTHFTGKLLPNSQSSQSAGLGLDGCHDRVGPDFFCGRQDYKPQTHVYAQNRSLYEQSQGSTNKTLFFSFLFFFLKRQMKIF